ncbi:MAG: pectinesterase family protein [Salinivirgaceae bacterium]
MKRKTLLLLIVLFTGLCSAMGQLPGAYSYDFRDGTLISAGQSPDGSLKLSGNYSHHGTSYGLNMKVDGQIKLAVTGSVTVRFLGSKYSGLIMEGNSKGGTHIGSQDTKVINDLIDTYDFVYSGGTDTLIFTLAAGSGNDLYLPEIEVIPAQYGGASTLTTAANNIVYYFDLRDGSIIPNETSLNGNYTIEQGLFKIESGASNAYGFNGSTHGAIVKTGNNITLKVAGNAFIKFGGCQYSNGTIAAASETGIFEVYSQASQTAACYHEDGSTIDFMYVGTEGTVVFEFTGTTYLPYIAMEPIPYDVSLETYIVKTGTIQVSNTIISYTSGETASDNAQVTVSEGSVISATSESASIRINLDGFPLSTYTPSFSGDIASVDVSHDSLLITLAGESTLPKNYVIAVADNSIVAEALPGITYSYSFADGSELPQISYSSLRYNTFVSGDGIVTLNSNTDTESLKFGYHDSSHGAVLFPGNSFDIIVAGNATITFGTCQYGSATDGIFEFTDAGGNVLGSTPSHNIGTSQCGTNSFTYTGTKGILTATLKSESFPTAEVYIHGLTIENAAEIIPSGKIDVWDFGAVQLDGETYQNNLNEAVINSWYSESITVGSSGNVLPSFSAGVLSWIGGGNDRLRTTNTNLTRYDENIAGVEGYTGRVYVNSAANTGRYLSLTLSEDDEVTLITKTDAGGNLNFEYVANPELQTDQVSLTSSLTELHFVAKNAGTYHIFDNQGKPSYYRIYRKDASYISIAGAVDLSQASGIPEDYALVFANEAGKTWTSKMAGNNYSIIVPAGYTYKLSLLNANGYVISNESTLEVSEQTTQYDVSIVKVDLYTVSGSILGLGDELAHLELAFTANPADQLIYIPEVEIDYQAATYSVQLEPGYEYTISAMGVNDFSIENNSITIGQADTQADITFVAKPVYEVSINAINLSTEQITHLGLSFTNLYEEGYVYNFNSIDNILLRSGIYSIDYSGLDAYPLALGLTSNLAVDAAPASKDLSFVPVNIWSFDDKPITSGDTVYKGLKFTGNVGSELAKGHLTAKPEATINVPVNVGQKIKITYYYSADFTIDATDSYSTSSGSTSTLEYAEYNYPGTDNGYVTITIGSAAGTTYITEIERAQQITYTPEISVGAGKDFASINEALAAIRQMKRTSDERVTVMIDPGNYEEMLVIDMDNVTLKNAASNPSIEILNKGVDIVDGAVRITSYYGHGYNYYSMHSNQKWNADVLRVNKENGYLSYENKGAGTSNGSYWNATVVISGHGFIADQIIFENSFNQYISQKESEDVIVLWESGNKGERPTDPGNTSVQNRSFVERAAAIAITNNTDKVILNKCRVIGRQDSFFGGLNTRVVVYKGAMMGAVDYIFGGMTAVFYKSDLVMNVSDNSDDRSYLTAAQQSGGRGYLMYECQVKSTIPQVETASAYLAKPGYFGRPWQATTSEVVFYNTTINTSNYAGYDGNSLIMPLGWMNTLGGESSKMYEYGTIEISGEDNSASRASWATLLSEPVLTDGTEITTFNFTKGTDNWDPIPALVAADITDAIPQVIAKSKVNVYAYQNQVFVTGIQQMTTIKVYDVCGKLVKSIKVQDDTSFMMEKGFWIVQVNDGKTKKAVKLITQ